MDALIEQPLNPIPYEQRQARTNDPSLPVHDKLYPETPSDLIDKLDAACQRPGTMAGMLKEKRPLDPGTSDLIRRAIVILAAVDRIPTKPTEYPELIWGRIRASFAGLGYAAHPELCRALDDAGFTDHPFTPSESYQDWLKAAHAARNDSGFPLSTCYVQWPELAAVYGAVEGAEADTQLEPWHLSVLAFHLASYVRREGTSKILYYYRDSVALPVAAGHASTPIMDGLQRLGASFAGMLGAKTTSKKQHHSPSIAIRKMLKAVLITSLPSVPNGIGSPPPGLILGPGAKLESVPPTDEPVPSRLRLAGAYALILDAKAKRARFTPSTADAVLREYSWPTPGTDSVAKQAAFDSRMPGQIPYADLELPFDRLCGLFRNIIVPAQDPAAYRARLNAALIGSFLPGAEEERPMIFVVPEEPSGTKSTGTGKTSVATALLKVFAPGLDASMPDTHGGTATARHALLHIHQHGTALFDEFVFSRSPDAPLSEAKLRTLTSGKAVQLALVSSNEATDVRLSAPLFASAKYVQCEDDMRSRALFVTVGSFAGCGMGAAEIAAVTSGAWSHRTQLMLRVYAALVAPDVADATLLLPSPGEHAWRYPTMRALASLLLANEESIPLADAAARIDGDVAAASKRSMVHTKEAHRHGITADSTSVVFGIEQVFSEQFCSEDILNAAAVEFPSGWSATALLRFIAVRSEAPSILAHALATVPLPKRATQPDLVRAFVQDLAAQLADPAALLVVPGQTAVFVTHAPKKSGVQQYQFDVHNPGSIKQQPVTRAPDLGNPFGAV